MGWSFGWDCKTEATHVEIVSHWRYVSHERCMQQKECLTLTLYFHNTHWYCYSALTHKQHLIPHTDAIWLKSLRNQNFGAKQRSDFNQIAYWRCLLPQHCLIRMLHGHNTISPWQSHYRSQYIVGVKCPVLCQYNIFVKQCYHRAVYNVFVRQWYM